LRGFFNFIWRQSTVDDDNDNGNDNNSDEDDGYDNVVTVMMRLPRC